MLTRSIEAQIGWPVSQPASRPRVALPLLTQIDACSMLGRPAGHLIVKSGDHRSSDRVGIHTYVEGDRGWKKDKDA